ncbi:flagellar basal body-associated protein FliL [Pokkaliibacter sp. CJK22405]|uniref:flagellar basal body-associated FliL family protein n=1 Tax=Pokkaliibacter sp. CJK22405 TaxID=3384615 RepID=UPI0039846D23
MMSRPVVLTLAVMLAGCDDSGPPQNSDFAKILTTNQHTTPSGNSDPLPENFLQIPETTISVPNMPLMEISITLQTPDYASKSNLSDNMPLVQHYLTVALSQVDMSQVKDQQARELLLMQVRDYVNDSLASDGVRGNIQRVLIDHLWVDRQR